MTNGEKIKEIFPNMECEVKYHTVLTNIDNGVWFSLEWWNAEYKEPSNSEKPNRSEIPTGSEDCISRKAALEIYDEWFATCNIADRKASPKAKINALPPVSPIIRPKGHWIDHSDEGYVECPRCGNATNCDDNINDLHFCFSCGAEMDGVEECKD